MNLPESFKERMKNDLKNEYDSFIKSYDEAPYIGLRVNTLKLSAEDFKNTVDFCGESVPWCDTGFYYDGKRGTHPSSIAGLFYSQEPSAMIAAELADVKAGDRVLDLCAAPGGKSTQLAAKLGGKGLLVSNEVNSGRAKILCENIERMGITNAVVTNMYPEKMEKLFGQFFEIFKLRVCIACIFLVRSCKVGEYTLYLNPRQLCNFFYTINCFLLFLFVPVHKPYTAHSRINLDMNFYRLTHLRCLFGQAFCKFFGKYSWCDVI